MAITAEQMKYGYRSPKLKDYVSHEAISNILGDQRREQAPKRIVDPAKVNGYTLDELGKMYAMHKCGQIRAWQVEMLTGFMPRDIKRQFLRRIRSERR